MASGSYKDLTEAIQQMDTTFDRTCQTSKVDLQDDGIEEADQQPQIASEDVVVEQFGKSLRQVAIDRDIYNTKSCEVCEQLRKDLRTLKSCQNLKGFDSEKMQEIIELLYQNKTRHEDVEEFLESMLICTYCINKLRENKVNTRSVFNKLTVTPTPECISDLNLFEKILIKFCMTCITIVRLGQVSNNARPQNELTKALKGRIAYLPLNVAANANFLPDNLLNVDNLVLLVAGQPTHKQKVWTSVVDLRKVHKALSWLRKNNVLYKDIPAYTVQQLEDIIQQKLDAAENNEVSNSSDHTDALLKKLNEASRSYLYENFSIQPLSTDVPADNVIDYQFSKTTGNSMNIFDTDLDVKAFPELFPTAENGIKDTSRKAKISTSEYIKSRLLNKDPKFRLNMQYLFHCFQTQEVSNLCHSIGHMLRCVTDKSLSAKAFCERLKQKDGEVSSNMFSMMANVRGSKEYFSKLGMDIKWMIRHLGPPTLFITCNTAEWFSNSFINYLRTVNSSVPGIDKMTPAEICAMDPVNVSIHFHKKWDTIFNKLIKSKQNPIFGEVLDYFWRIEYQSRGAPHVHCMLWIKNAPVIGKNSPAEIEQYINSIMTCAMPDKWKSPTLHALVSKFQKHKCNSYCTKKYKKGNKFFKKCRFSFPRLVRTKFQLNDITECLAVSKNKQPRKRLYHLKRNKEEVLINDYNPALLLANEANVDIQYIGHEGSRLPYYITDYMTKHERSEQDSMWQDIFSTSKSLGSNSMSYAQKALKSRQVGANEAADRLLGHKLYSKSRQLRFADLQPATKAKRVLKPVEDITRIIQTNPDSSDIFQPHIVLDIYPDRPNELESCSLYKFLSCYEKETLPAGNTKPLQLKTLPYYLRERKAIPYIVTHKLVKPNESDEKKETYYFYLLKLFKPWRNESELSIPGKTYYETYLSESENFPDMAKYHKETMKTANEHEEIEKKIRERAEEMSRVDETREDEEGAFAGCAVSHLDSAMQDLVEACAAAHTNDKQLKEDYMSLNKDQKRVVDTVVAAICEKEEPIHLLVSGEGGTGKSRVIDVLNRLVCSKFTSPSVPVVVSAPTGLSAFNIGGTTIHRVLSLPVEHGKPPDYNRLSQDQLVVIRAVLKGLKLLIIDEVSMVSSLTLLYIHLRLTEIMSTDEHFGGISTVCFGELFQLPPVKGNQPFIPVTFLEAKQRLGAIASLDLWNIFRYDELTINMRQKGDSMYAGILSDIRVGKLTSENYKLLSNRMITTGRRATVAEICETYNKIVEENTSPLVLLPKTSLCDELNSAMMHQIGNEIYNLPAIDTLDTIVSKTQMTKVQKAYSKTDEDTTRTGGLEKNLQLCIGARVMLKRNKDVDAGLVNGSVGTVVDFCCTEKDTLKEIYGVKVKFNNIECPINIGRECCSFEVLKGIYYTRKQFPLMLSFAITVHKAQGLSLETAIVDAGPSTFGCGMVYVALSRVTTLQGLYLIDLDQSKIKADGKAIQEYNRLRQTYQPHLEPITACHAERHLREEKRLPVGATMCRKRKANTEETIAAKRRATRQTNNSSKTNNQCKANKQKVTEAVHLLQETPNMTRQPFSIQISITFVA